MQDQNFSVILSLLRNSYTCKFGSKEKKRGIYLQANIITCSVLLLETYSALHTSVAIVYTISIDELSRVIFSLLRITVSKILCVKLYALEAGFMCPTLSNGTDH